MPSTAPPLHPSPAPSPSALADQSSEAFPGCQPPDQALCSPVRGERAANQVRALEVHIPAQAFSSPLSVRSCGSMQKDLCFCLLEQLPSRKVNSGMKQFMDRGWNESTCKGQWLQSLQETPNTAGHAAHKNRQQMLDLPFFNSALPSACSLNIFSKPMSVTCFLGCLRCLQKGAAAMPFDISSYLA